MVEHPEKEARLAAASTENQAAQIRARVAEIEAAVDVLINRRTAEGGSDPIAYEFACDDRRCCAEIARMYREAGWIVRVQWSASEDGPMRPTITLS